MSNPLFLYIDLFCGAGGVTTGIIQAKNDGNKLAKVIACVNHDPKAIKSHWLNHPEVVHYEEDIRTLDITGLVELVNKCRIVYPDAYVILWASLECTNFSKAKGGQPRDADSRTLAEHLYRYIQSLDPDYIQIENVVEFMSWGPLDKNGKPISRRNGQDWLKWREHINSFGYYDDWTELNSANYGAYTSRNRLFGCFAKHGLPVVWPELTHAKSPAKNTLYRKLKKWKPVKDVLDFDDEGESIFTRKKPLSDRTLERIYAGLVKYIANGDTSFIQKYYSCRPAGKVISTDVPAGTITTVDGQALVQAMFLLKYNSTNGKTGKHIPPSIDDPSPVVSTQGRLGLVQPEFLASYYGNGDNISSIEGPCPTLTTKDRVSVVQPRYFIDQQYGNSKPKSIDKPAGTILTNDKHNVASVEPFIMPTHYNNMPRSVDDPLPVITANRKHHYVVNPTITGVIAARSDKQPLYFIQADAGRVGVAVYDCDSEVMIRIKQFMSAYGLADIKMRMLRVRELLRIQGFPNGYQLEGNQTDQKKFIGNSVVPQVVKAWVEAMGERLLEKLKNKCA